MALGDWRLSLSIISSGVLQVVTHVSSVFLLYRRVVAHVWWRGGQRNGSPKMSSSETQEPLTMFSYMARGLCRWLKFRILTYGQFLGISRWAQCNHMGLLRERGEGQVIKKVFDSGSRAWTDVL